MPEEKPQSGQPYDPVKDRESSALPMGSEDILPDNPERVASRKKEEARLAFKAWYTNSIRSVFGNALSQIFSNVFGQSDKSIHFRVRTDHAPDDEAVGFVGERDNLQPEISTTDALITPQSIVPGYRIGVLVVYRAKGDNFEPFVLNPEANDQIRRFEAERTQKHGQWLSPTGPARGAHFDLASGRFPVASPIDLVVIGSSELESRVFLTTPSQRPVLALKDWGLIQDWLADQLEAKGGDAGVEVALVSETWQDRWVAPERKSNDYVPPGRNPSGGPSDAPGSDLTSIQELSHPLGWSTVIENIKRLSESGIEPNPEHRAALRRYIGDDLSLPLTETQEGKAQKSRIDQSSNSPDGLKFQQSYMNELRDLVARVSIGDASKGDKKALFQIILRAKAESPADSEAFVELVNRALDAMNLRIELPDGSLAKLRMTPGASGKGFIQFKLHGSESSARGWQKTRPSRLAPFE